MPVTTWVLRQQVRGLVGWSVGVAAVSAVYGGFYPLMGSTAQLQELIDTLPPSLVTALGYEDIGSAAGYVTSTVFGLLGPILLLVAGLSWAAQLVAGDEEGGLLELEAAAPLSRRARYAQRYAALLAVVLLLGGTVGAVSLAVTMLLDLDITTGGIAAATVALVLLAVALASVAFAVGAATGRRGLALGIGSGLAVGSFVADAVVPLLERAPAWAAHVSPFAWALGDDPIVNGLDVAGAAGLVALAVVSAAIGMVVHDRRDLGV
jgi:ABC-2 type transport system permease protein